MDFPILQSCSSITAPTSIRKTTRVRRRSHTLRNTNILRLRNCCAITARLSSNKRGSAEMPPVLLARWNRKRQAILLRWQRTGSELRECARRTVGLIEIDHDVARRVRRIDIQIATSRISLFAACPIGDDHEEPRFVFLTDCVEPIFLTI